MEKKKTLDDTFDVVGVINKTYQDSTEYDLNDSLIFLGNVISKTKVKNKELVKKNFSKFVECRIVLEEILSDMKKKGLDISMSSDVKDNIKRLQEKFKKLTEKILINSQYDDSQEKRSMIKKRYKTLFTLKDLLKENLKSKERFVNIYQEGHKQYEELKGSKYIQMLWDDVKEIRKEFLESIYREIQAQDNCYVEVLYYFDLYFKVCEKKTDRKIMNTLLLNFKEKVLDVPYVERGYFLKETNYFYLRTMLHLDKELQRELSKTLFKKVEEVFAVSSLSFIKIWVKKYKKLIYKINVALEVSSAYHTTLKFLKKNLISKRVDASLSMEQLFCNFKFFDEMLDKDEKYILYKRFIDIVKEKIEEEDLTTYSKIDLFIKQLNRYDKFIKGCTDLFDDYEELKKGVLNRELRKEIAYLAKFVQTTCNKACVLMEIVRTIDRAPVDFKKIINGASAAIEKDKVVLYFLHKILGKNEPNLTNLQSEEADKLKKQFGFLKAF